AAPTILSLLTRLHPSSPPFPYTTLFRSPHRDGPPPRDPADARPAQPHRPPHAPLVAPGRGARQPRSAARDHLARARPAAGRVLRRLRRDRHPAVPRRDRELRLAEIGRAHV